MINYIPKKILVTGGAGFIGSNFIRYVVKNLPETYIVNLDLLTYAGSRKNLSDLPTDRHILIEGNIGDRDLVKQLLRSYGIDTIVHFAAESHVDRSIVNPQQFIETNILGTHILLEGARQYWLHEANLTHEQCRFYHVSTDEVYGSLHINDLPFSEVDPYRPSSPYSASKASSDHLVYSYYHTYGFPVIITHCSNNYGPYQHQEKFIPTIINNCLNWQPIPIYGDGDNVRDWIYVDDHCEAITLILKNGRVGETYNVGSENEITNIKLANQICALMDVILKPKQSYQTLINYVADRPGHDFRYALNVSKLTQKLGWKANTDFLEGLKRTIEFYIGLGSKIKEISL